jgi:hypothetical protein
VPELSVLSLVPPVAWVPPLPFPPELVPTLELEAPPELLPSLVPPLVPPVAWTPPLFLPPELVTALELEAPPEPELLPPTVVPLLPPTVVPLLPPPEPEPLLLEELPELAFSVDVPHAQSPALNSPTTNSFFAKFSGRDVMIPPGA